MQIIDKRENKKYNIDNAVILKFCDNQFFQEYNLNNVTYQVEQDEYLTIQAYIVDLLSEKLNLGFAYTSTSSIAGFFCSENDLIIVFVKGEPIVLFNNENQYLINDLFKRWD
jgi:hypothetical protein